MRRVRRTVVAATLIALCGASIAQADRSPGGSDRPGGARVTPASRLDGSPGSKLLAQWFSQLLALSPAENPLAGNGEPCLRLGHHGRILSPVNGGARTTVRCTVAAHRPVFLVSTDTDCSTAEEGDFHAEGAANQARCALEQLQLLVPLVPSIKVTVDNGPPVEIRTDTYVLVSTQGRTVFPDDAIFEPSTAGPATFAGAAWAAKVRGLKPGTHTIRVDYTFSTGSFTAEFVLDAIRARHHHGDRGDDRRRVKHVR